MIYADQNENSVCNIPSRLKALNLPIIIATPPADQFRYDYTVVNSLGSTIAIERKEIKDYLQSKLSGHLDKQLYLYSSAFDLTYLVIIGNVFKALMEQGLSRKLYLSSLIGSSLKHSPDGKNGQIITVNLDTDDDFVLFLQTLHEKNELNDFVRLPKFERHNPAPNDLSVNFLCGLPNIGPKKAKLILQKYGSVSNALTIISLTGSWDVKGLGEKTLVEIQKVLEHKFISNNLVT